MKTGDATWAVIRHRHDHRGRGRRARFNLTVLPAVFRLAPATALKGGSR